MTFDPNDKFINLKGKQYLEVKWRLVWFRQEVANGLIETEHISISDQEAIFKATITIHDGNGVVIAKSTGYGSEKPKDFGDYIEKAETKSVGRALAMLGYGTQFAPELEEGERIVDSPVARTTRQPTPITPQPRIKATVNNPYTGPQAHLDQVWVDEYVTKITNAESADEWRNLVTIANGQDDPSVREAYWLLLVENAPTLPILNGIKKHGEQHRAITARVAAAINYRSIDIAA